MSPARTVHEQSWRIRWSGSTSTRLHPKWYRWKSDRVATFYRFCHINLSTPIKPISEEQKWRLVKSINYEGLFFKKKHGWVYKGRKNSSHCRFWVGSIQTTMIYGSLTRLFHIRQTKGWFWKKQNGRWATCDQRNSANSEFGCLQHEFDFIWVLTTYQQRVFERFSLFRRKSVFKDSRQDVFGFCVFFCSWASSVFSLRKKKQKWVKL
jgi:hypothetical protein